MDSSCSSVSSNVTFEEDVLIEPSSPTSNSTVESLETNVNITVNAKKLVQAFGGEPLQTKTSKSAKGKSLLAKAKKTAKKSKSSLESKTPIAVKIVELHKGEDGEETKGSHEDTHSTKKQELKKSKIQASNRDQPDLRIKRNNQRSTKIVIDNAKPSPPLDELTFLDAEPTTSIQPSMNLIELAEPCTPDQDEEEEGESKVDAVHEPKAGTCQGQDKSSHSLKKLLFTFITLLGVFYFGNNFVISRRQEHQLLLEHLEGSSGGNDPLDGKAKGVFSENSDAKGIEFTKEVDTSDKRLNEIVLSVMSEEEREAMEREIALELQREKEEHEQAKQDVSEVSQLLVPLSIQKATKFGLSLMVQELSNTTQEEMKTLETLQLQLEDVLEQQEKYLVHLVGFIDGSNQGGGSLEEGEGAKLLKQCQREGGNFHPLFKLGEFKVQNLKLDNTLEGRELVMLMHIQKNTFERSVLAIHESSMKKHELESRMKSLTGGAPVNLLRMVLRENKISSASSSFFFQTREDYDNKVDVSALLGKFREVFKQIRHLLKNDYGVTEHWIDAFEEKHLKSFETLSMILRLLHRTVNNNSDDDVVVELGIEEVRRREKEYLNNQEIVIRFSEACAEYAKHFRSHYKLPLTASAHIIETYYPMVLQQYQQLIYLDISNDSLDLHHLLSFSDEFNWSS